MKILIIEDEAYAAEALAEAITKIRPQTEILESIETVEEGIDWLRSNEAPDLIISDIHLADGNSFEIFDAVEVLTPVIFLTAYDEYALKAFKLNSIDYLLKPVDNTKLEVAIKQYENLQNNQLKDYLNNMKTMLQQQTVEVGQGRRSRFMVKEGHAFKTVNYDEVAYFMAARGEVFLVTRQGKRFLIDKTLDALSDELYVSDFFRANRQFLVHINSVSEVRPYFKGRLKVSLNPEPGEDVLVSNKNAGDFKSWMDF
ncbi:LytR/AlgR family response regulator transcription factor [Robertkochia aurantiaca]|uniref:LytR/AlgR family response regulator transcription factor n=1 Tax=Robertkochia aurantiaca TaxID=2873700 RepID=UPI001CCF2BE6|nr:LytTR family DNA-binding domain-containing protein [Robertkochia sp. 3YJGBD-33]